MMTNASAFREVACSYAFGVKGDMEVQLASNARAMIAKNVFLGLVILTFYSYCYAVSANLHVEVISQ